MSAEPAMLGASDAPSAEAVRKAAIDLTRGRVVLGATALVAPTLVRRVFRFPREQETDAATYAMRLYAVRELALGLHLWREASQGVPSVLTARLNTAIDGVDVVMSVATAAVVPSVRKPALFVAAFAGVVTTQWVRFERMVEAYHTAQS